MLQPVDLAIRLHPDDDVVIARVEIPADTLLTRENVRVRGAIPPGHKLASGRRTKSELLGFGEDEFAPWVVGATM